MGDKISWHGRIIAVQPRIRLNRSFDQRSHGYLGYMLRMEGSVSGEEREFTIGVGKGAQAKHSFQIGMAVRGLCEPVADPRKEPVEFYKISKIEVVETPETIGTTSPPWLGVPITLEEYRSRGHRRLAARTYETKCSICVWGCRMPVEMIIDQWKPSQVKYRVETFCYGPKICPDYKSGPTRKVPGRKGMTWEEPDWVDEEATAHRELDD